MVARKHISDDVKLAAIKLHLGDLLPLEDILDVVGFSESTFWRTLRLYCATGHVSKPKSHRSGRPHTLNMNDIQYLLALVNHCPDYFNSS
ncbi:hypothetical protein BDP27DRAFT_1236142 [Rhodocollybia butyracea]|uniref:Uncharacterized protein n=1 Tax=Rhodocollybia butyracea TaxID=206335 RepID=A0A9P5TZH9_9AGAR|nr:hypothetical protein BDP27DRAFT_1236142 [Rhodocollybia butyracea]